MELLPVTALSSWTHCPRQFYLNYVLKEKDPPNAAMILGLLKHKLHETIAAEEQNSIQTLKPEENATKKMHDQFNILLRKLVAKQAYALRNVNITLMDAYQKTAPIAQFEAKRIAETVSPLLSKGLTGEDLWHAITPKIKTEYSLKSTKLGLKGRIDKLEIYENNIIPVELKSGRLPEQGVWDGHRIQAASYAMMLEEQFNTTIPEAIVHYIDHDIRRAITINPFMKEEVKETTKAAKECIHTKEVPKGCTNEKCTACKHAVFVQNQL